MERKLVVVINRIVFVGNPIGVIMDRIITFEVLIHHVSIFVTLCVHPGSWGENTMLAPAAVLSGRDLALTEVFGLLLC